MAGVQDLRRKIKSIKSTAKLTQAMQMVAASKMNKAIEAATASRAYSNLAWEIIQGLKGDAENLSPLLKSRPINKKLLVVFSSNKGLAGGFNAQVIKKTLDLIDDQTDLVTIGRKGKNYFARFHKSKLIADFDSPETHPKVADIENLSLFLRGKFLSGEYDQIGAVFNEFKSAAAQSPTYEQIFPVRPSRDESSRVLDTVIEPDAKTVIDHLVPRVVLARIYQIFLDSAASEHASRMIAMKNATDNAKEILGDLTLTYQGVRQAGITREIIEVSSGANALNM